jgi:hypothetical protein
MGKLDGKTIAFLFCEVRHEDLAAASAGSEVS